MLCKAIKKGDVLEFDGNHQSWILTSDNGAIVGAPNMKIRISPDMLFMCDDSGNLSILKSSLKRYTARQCFDSLLDTFKVALYYDNALCESLDKDPNLTKDYSIINLYNMKMSAVK